MPAALRRIGFDRGLAAPNLERGVRNMKSYLAMGITLAAAWFAPASTASASSPSDASRASLNASMAVPATLVQGGAQFFRDAGKLSVTGVKTVGNMTVYTLRGAASGAEASVQASARGIEGSAIAVGSVLEGTVFATGTLLVSAGKVLMFVPNELGRSLLHHSRAQAL
jgi:hypothetical protein